MNILKGIFYVWTGILTIGVFALAIDYELDFYSLLGFVITCLGAYIIYTQDAK